MIRTSDQGATGRLTVPTAPPLLRLVVIGDSFAFTDDRGPQLPDAPHVYPHVTAGILEKRLDRRVDVTVVARAGWGVRELWRSLSKDQHVQFGMIAGADAVVFGVGSFDHVPTGVPAVTWEIVRHLRPATLRRRVRRTLHAAHPWLIRATAGRFPVTPDAEFERLLDRCLLQVRGLTRGAAGVVLGPVGHRAAHYDLRNPHLRRRIRMQEAIADRHGFAVVPAWPHVAAALDRLNPDGIHWPADVHEAIGRDVAERLAAQLQGAEPRPSVPGQT